MAPIQLLSCPLCHHQTPRTNEEILLYGDTWCENCHHRIRAVEEPRPKPRAPKKQLLS